MRLCQTTIAILLLLQLAGGHWLVLQGVAWAKMFSADRETSSLTQRILQTVDPERPCSLCLSIREARSKEQEQNSSIQFSKTKIELVCGVRGVELVPPGYRPVSYPRINESQPLSWSGDVPHQVPKPTV